MLLNKGATVAKLDLSTSAAKGEDGIEALALELRENTDLLSLHLGGSNLGDAGVALLTSALEQNATLETLVLSSCAVGLAGSASIASFLTQDAYSSLHSLDLYNNAMGDMGAKALSTALETNTTLKCLKLQSPHQPQCMAR